MCAPRSRPRCRTTSTAPPASSRRRSRRPRRGEDAVELLRTRRRPGRLGGVAAGRVRRAPRLDSPKRALQALHAMTQRFSAEWAIRPFIEHHPDAHLRHAGRAGPRDPSAHVRRLVSEGSRPRLPWGLQLKALIADPSPTLPLLRALQDDPSEYVRRSVANHLNDIAKDHPGLVADWLERPPARCPAAAPRAAPPRQPHADQARRSARARGLGPGPAVRGRGEPVAVTAPHRARRVAHARAAPALAARSARRRW